MLQSMHARAAQPAHASGAPPSRCPAVRAAGSSSGVGSSTYEYRVGRASDVGIIRQRLLEEKMNPIGLQPERFTLVTAQPGGQVVAFAQLAPLPAAAPRTALEFRSLVVAPEHRGRGVGSALLKHVVGGCPHDIYATTLRPTLPFYEAAGFQLLPLTEVPWFLWFEVAAGTAVAALAVRQQLICVLRPAVPHGAAGT